MATQLKAVPALAPFAAALMALDDLRNAVVEMTHPDADGVDLRLTMVECPTNGSVPAIALTITLKPFVDATRTVIKLESGFLTGYGVKTVRSTLESTSSSRRVVTAFILPEIARG